MKGIVKISDLPTELSVEELMQVKGGDAPVINCSAEGSGVCTVKGTGMCYGEGSGFSCNVEGSGVIFTPDPGSSQPVCDLDSGPYYT